jgi:hypothetical protein
MLHEESPRPSGATDPPSEASALALVARQSVYDPSLTVIAYVLLYRGSATAVSTDLVDSWRRQKSCSGASRSALKASKATFCSIP